MSGFLNRVQLIGNLGRDPEVRTMQNGGQVVTLSIATSESWKDDSSGERRERTEWHRVVIVNEGLGKLAERYLQKGAKVYLEGKLTRRKWQDQSGADRYSTEIHLTPFNGVLTFLDSRRDGERPPGGEPAGAGPRRRSRRGDPVLTHRSERAAPTFGAAVSSLPSDNSRSGIAWKTGARSGRRRSALPLPCVNGASTPSTCEIWQRRDTCSPNNAPSCSARPTPQIYRPTGGQTSLPRCGAKSAIRTLNTQICRSTVNVRVRAYPVMGSTAADPESSHSRACR